MSLKLILFVVGYLAVGLAHSIMRCWSIGVHRASAHDGERHRGCHNWACGLMADDGMTLILACLFWPISIIAHWGGRLLYAVMRAPYLRSLPPDGSMDDGRLKEKK